MGARTRHYLDRWLWSDDFSWFLGRFWSTEHVSWSWRINDLGWEWRGTSHAWCWCECLVGASVEGRMKVKRQRMENCIVYSLNENQECCGPCNL